LKLHKIKSALYEAHGVESVDILGKHAIVRFDGSLISASEVNSYAVDLSVPAIKIFPDPAGVVAVDFFHLDNYPKFSLGFSIGTLLLSLSGTVPALAMNMLLIFLSLPVYTRAYEALVKDKKLSVDFLDALAHITAQLQQNYSAVAFMSVILNVGGMLRHKTTAQAKKVISDVLSFTEKEAWVERDGKKVRLPVSEIKKDDGVIIYPGEVIPVDGEVLSGVSSVDQKSFTGESLPVLKEEHEKVYAGTVVIDGVLKVRTERVGNETSLAQIVKLVTEGAEAQTEIEDYARKFGDNLVLPILGISGVVGALTGDLSRFTSMIIVDYGTGMRVSAPTAFLSQMIRAARSGVLIKGGRSIEMLNKADTVVFDKTGTLTIGKPVVHDVVSLDKSLTSEDILRLAAAAECEFTHPVARAMISEARGKGIEVPAAYEVKYHIGRGVEARIIGKKVLVGSEKFMAENRMDISAARETRDQWYASGRSALFVAVTGRLAGLISYSDVLREEARETIKHLRARGIKKVVMLTGDNPKVAAAIAGELGVDDFVAGILPEEKAAYIKNLQGEGHIVVAVGDGINDSPALLAANVGISVVNGVELAKQASDIVLLEENLRKVEEAFAFASSTMGIIKTNRKILYLVNAGVFTAAAFGLLSPTLSSAISDGASVLATLNSIRPVTRDMAAARKLKIKIDPVIRKIPADLELSPVPS
jgi:heavy metal translocating P-type ATPase